MWEVISTILNNPIVQIFVAAFSGVFSYDQLKKFYNRPIIKIKIWDRKSKNHSDVKINRLFKKKWPFFYIERHCDLTVTGKDIIISLLNEGRSSVKELSLYGWIPELWKVHMNTESSVLKGGIIRIEDWEREIDDFESGNTDNDQGFRFIGELPPTYSELIKLEVSPPTTYLEFCMVGEKIGHSLIHIDLVFKEERVSN